MIPRVTFDLQRPSFLSTKNCVGHCPSVILNLTFYIYNCNIKCNMTIVTFVKMCIKNKKAVY